MNNILPVRQATPKDAPANPIQPMVAAIPACQGGHCITCSDEAVTVVVMQVDPEEGLALVMTNGVMEEVDVTLVEEAGPGDLLLVHSGVAIARLDEVRDDEFGSL